MDRAARRLGITRSTIYRLVQKHGLEGPGAHREAAVAGPDAPRNRAG